MANQPVFHGGIAIIKVGGVPIGKMKNLRFSESYRRLEVRGLGTIIASELPVTEMGGTCSCSFMSIEFKTDGIKNAVRRIFPNVLSQVLTGGTSFEDQILLDTDGVQIDVFKKITDIIDSNGFIKPKLIPYAILRGCQIESMSVDLSEGAIAAVDQGFKFTQPIVFPS